MIGGGKFDRWHKDDIFQLLKNLENAPATKRISKDKLLEDYLYTTLEDLNSNLLDNIFSLFSSDETAKDVDEIYCSLVEKLADNYNIKYGDRTKVETVEKKIEAEIIKSLRKNLSKTEQYDLISQFDNNVSKLDNLDSIITKSNSSKSNATDYSKIIASIAVVSLMGFMGSSVLRIGKLVMSSKTFSILGTTGWGIGAFFAAQKMFTPDYDKILLLVLFCNYVKQDLD